MKPPQLLPSPDHCSRQGALALKERIEEYWRERGATVNADLVERGFHHAIRATRFALRSDLINGLPRFCPSLEADS